MYRHMLSVVAAIVTALTAVPAIAQVAGDDVRCMIVSEAFSKLEKDPARRQLAMSAGLFYFGRVDAQISGPALRTQFLAQKRILQKQDAGQIMTACAKAFIARQRGLQASLRGGVVPASVRK